MAVGDQYFPRCEKWHCKRIRFQLVYCRFARFAMPGNGHSFETYHLISNWYNTQINFPIRVDDKTSDWIYIECRYEVQLVINIGIVYSRGKGGEGVYHGLISRESRATQLHSQYDCKYSSYWFVIAKRRDGDRLNHSEMKWIYLLGRMIFVRF